MTTYWAPNTSPGKPAWPTEPAELELLAQAAEAYGLQTEEILAAVVREGEVTLVTIGGHKARWREGQTVKPLSDLQAGRPTRTGGRLTWKAFKALPSKRQHELMERGEWPPRTIVASRPQ